MLGPGGILTSLIALAPVLLLAACERSAGETQATVRVFTYAGSLQCSPGSGASLAEMAAPLKDAGVRVVRAVCGRDGLLTTARCGAGDGRIGIFEIPAADLKKADSLNYQKTGALPDLIEAECPARR
jgi:hypothetical protein